MEINEYDSSRSAELDSSWTHNQVVEFGVNCVKIIMNVKNDLEILKSGQKAEISPNASSHNSKNKGQQFDVNDNVKDSVIPRHHTTKSKPILLTEALNKITIQRVILGVLLCTLTVAILVPTGFAVRTLLQDGDASEFEFPIYQNHCKINEPSMVG